MTSPLFSVVIPTCNRNDLLSRCLDCLSPGAQTVAAELYEVLVTDDGALGPAEELVKQRYPWAKWTAGPRRGPAANRNNGAGQATGTWLAFVDDDCLPDKNWLGAIQAAAGPGDVEMIEGKTVIPDKVDNPFKPGAENLFGGVFWSCNLAVKRETFLALGGFDEDFLEPCCEDMEFAWRMQSRKFATRFVPEALVLHPTRTVGWRWLLWRTRTFRWVLLFRHKIGQAVPLTESGLKAGVTVALDHLKYVMIRTRNLICKPDREAWRTELFFQVWNWLTLPFFIPYLIVWELRFRKILAGRSSRTGKDEM